MYGHPSTEPPTKRLTEWHFLEKIPAYGKKAKPEKRCVVCAKQKKVKSPHTDAQTVKQGSVWRNASRFTTQS
jgi:hypothetical protein